MGRRGVLEFSLLFLWAIEDFQRYPRVTIWFYRHQRLALATISRSTWRKTCTVRAKRRMRTTSARCNRSMASWQDQCKSKQWTTLLSLRSYEHRSTVLSREYSLKIQVETTILFRSKSCHRRNCSLHLRRPGLPWMAQTLSAASKVRVPYLHTNNPPRLTQHQAWLLSLVKSSFR